MTTTTKNVKKVRVLIKPWLARENHIPVSIDGYIDRKTDRAIYLIGHGSVDSPICCVICGRDLTHPVSRITGIGPICSEKVGFNRPSLDDLTESDISRLRNLVMGMTVNQWLPISQIKDIQDLGTETITANLSEPKPEIPKISNPGIDPKIFRDGIPMRSRFPSECKVCNNPIIENSPILYKKGIGAAHENCVFSEKSENAETITPRGINPKEFIGSVEITSQFSSTCRICLEPISTNDAIAYKKGVGAAHLLCAFPNRGETKKHLEEMVQKKQETHEMSKTSTSTLEIPGLKGTPYPFQLAGIEFCQKMDGRVIIGDEMGLGKTIQALGYLQLNFQKRPAIIIVPAVVKENWAREANKWLSNSPNNKVTILEGGNTFKLEPNGIYVINYDIISKWQEEIERIKPQIMVLDECHYLKNPKAQRTISIFGKGWGNQRVPGLVDKISHIIALSGTPLVNRPIELFPILNTLRSDIKEFSNVVYYGKVFCNGEQTKHGWNFTGSSNTEKLHKLLRETVMVRRLKSEVLKELPEKTRTSIPLEISNRAEYERAEYDFRKWLIEQGDTPPNAAEHLVKIEKLKQLAITGKYDAAISWISDFLESGEKLVVFVTHRDVAKAIGNNFENSVTILGGDNNRQEKVDKFQNDPNCHLAICGIRAAGVGITLTAASNTVFLEFGWTPGEHQQAEDRVHRIGQRNAVTAWYLIAQNTIDEKIAALIDNKAKVLAAILDGKEELAQKSILEDLVKEYQGKAA